MASVRGRKRRPIKKAKYGERIRQGVTILIEEGKEVNRESIMSLSKIDFAMHDIRLPKQVNPLRKAILRKLERGELEDLVRKIKKELKEKGRSKK